MFNKIVLVGIVVGAVIIGYIITFAMSGFMREVSDIAYNGTGAENMTGYREAVGSFPWWGLTIPGIVGVVAIILILRAPEKR